MRRRSSVKRCLLCLAYCSTENEEGVFYRELYPPQQQQQLNIAGAVNCPQLHRHLENVFILRRILEVPGVWCEEALKEECAEGEDQDNGPASWFSVCRQCIGSSVTEAWSIYQQILALEVKMLEVRHSVKMRMQEELLKKSTGHHQLGSGCSKLEEKIRNFVFPELILTKVEVVDQCMIEAYSDQGDNDLDQDFLMDDGVSNSSDSVHMGEDLTDFGEHASSSEFPFQRFTEKTNRERQKHGRKWRGKGKRNTSSYRRAPTKSVKDEHSRKERKWYFCREPKCRTRCYTLEELESHYQAHQDQQARQQEMGGNGEKGELDCPHCPFPARSKVELETHMESRHKRTHRPYYFSCPNCTFTVQNDFPQLRDHFDREHPPSPADIEREETPENATLASDLPVMCPLCNKRCGNLKSFTIHQRSMHPEQIGIQLENLECSECGVKFSTKLDLQSHINIKHNYPNKASRSKFVCDECGKGFPFLSKLEYHQTKHVNKVKRNFVCHLCGLDYAYKWILDKHYRVVHGGGAEETSSASASADVSSSAASATTSGEGKKIQCKYCEFSCAIKGIMIRHVQQHKEEMGFKCEQCGKSYVNEPGLKRHLKINHPLVKEEIPCPHCLKTFSSVDYMRDHVRMYCKVKKLSDPTISATSSFEATEMENSI